MSVTSMIETERKVVPILRESVDYGSSVLYGMTQLQGHSRDCDLPNRKYATI